MRQLTIMGTVLVYLWCFFPPEISISYMLSRHLEIITMVLKVHYDIKIKSTNVEVRHFVKIQNHATPHNGKLSV